MTALKRLQMLTTAYEQLRALSRTRQYRDCSQLVQAVIQLMAHFRSYRSIDQIATLSRNVADIQRELLEQVCEDFELASSRGEVVQKREILAEGCLVMDALGDHARSRLVTWYCNAQLREYRQVFRNHEEAGSLDNISRRYSWFRRILRGYDEEYAGIFPSSWRVNEILANVFCEETRNDFKGILARSVRNGQTIDVNLLLSCLQETLDFEHALERRFATDSRPSTDTFASNEVSIFSPTISGAFEPYLSLWVESQDKQLATLIPKYRQQPLKPLGEEFNSQAVISSSTELFTFYRHSLQQCARLSTGGSLAELANVFAKYLDQYAQQILLHYISERPSGLTPSKVPSVEDLIMVLNTADYCYTTCNQLEEKIKGRVDESLKPIVDLQSQADSFMGIASAAVRAFVRRVEVDLEPCWREMRNTPWSKLETVNDHSSYVGEILSKAKARSEEFLPLLHKHQYARAFVDHVVEHVSSLFSNNVFQCKPISETGAEQMLLDSYSLKTGLASLLPPPAPTGFVKRVNLSFSKIEPFLKTLQVHPSPPEALVQAYLLHIADKSNANFRRILDVKGIRSRQEQNQLVELFQVHRDSDRHKGNLQTSNPLLNTVPNTNTNPNPNQSQQNANANASANAAASSPAVMSALPGRFDPSLLGSALISAAKDGVDRFGNPIPSLTSSASRGATGNVSAGGGGGASTNNYSGAPAASSAGAGAGSTSGSGSGSATAPSSETATTQQQQQQQTAASQVAEGNSGSTTNSNDNNLSILGKFFRRDLGGFGGRFGRGGDDGAAS